MPTERQLLGSQIRAAEEAWTLRHRKPYMGGFLVPPREEKYRYLSEEFGLSPYEISYFLVWSRSCSHPWSDGACEGCPK